MKPISTLKKNLLACSLAAILLGSTALVFAATEPVKQGAGDITYVSGGVGDESLARMTAMVSDYNVKFVFAKTSGEFVSGVMVTITDSKGRSVVEARSDGPWFLTRLPAGNYQIAASLAGKTERQQIDVGSSKLSTVDFRWTGN